MVVLLYAKSRMEAGVLWALLVMVLGAQELGDLEFIPKLQII